MNIEDFRNYCLKKAAVTEEFPFDEDTLVFKVMGKMFALTSLSFQPFRVNLKCEPEKAIVLRDQYSSIEPGYHMSKVHWNSIYFESGELSDKQLRELIDHSYELVVKGLPKKYQQQLLG